MGGGEWSGWGRGRAVLFVPGKGRQGVLRWPVPVILTKVRIQGYGRWAVWLWVLTFVRMTGGVRAALVRRRGAGLSPAILTQVRIQGPERRAAWRRGVALVGTTARGAFTRRAQITFISA